MIGKEILNYVITDFIGKGGMGSVYVAENKHIRQQKVAIKVINADMVNEFTRTKLKEEAERLASLNHPNIVHFLNYDIDEKGNVYLIMEYADGVSLDRYIATISGLIVEERICPLFEPILDAVGYAHKHKILHRDIKPSNIIITKEGTPKILDFGIARIIKNEGEEESDNMIMGTPSYMSPEQVKGEHLDERSDIYSLGVLLHQMLTGNAPYDTTTMTELDINRKVVEEQLPRMKTFYKYVSDKVQAVVDKATAKKPEARYRSCEEFKKALHKAIYPPKMPLWVKLSTAAVVLLLVGLGVFWWDYTRTKVYYYKDYVEQWGIPVGIGEIESGDVPHTHRMYRFEYTRRQLQRVSHVNSLDVIIQDGESERIDRPMDARFIYNNKGKLHQVKVYDHNGKVLYVKEYNETLQTAIFRFDDANGTEKTLGSQTVGYVNTFANDSQKRGKISRYLLEYDANGYVKTIRYAGFQNVRVGDDNNIYGVCYQRDSKGRATEISYMDSDDSPKATRWGMGKKRFYYDDRDNWVKSEYLTIDGAPALDDTDGVCIYVLEYDQYGNVTCALFQDENGKPMYPKKQGYAGVRTTYDEHGYICRQEILDEDGNLMYSRDGYAVQETKCDANGFFNDASYFDTEGQPVLCNEGYYRIVSVNDEKGNNLEQWYYGLNGELVVSKDNYAGIVCTLDTLGNLESLKYFDTNRLPYVGEDGTSGVLAEHDSYGRMTKLTNIDAEGHPCYSTDQHVEMMVFQYDPAGNETERRFLDSETGELVDNFEGIALIRMSYDDKGNPIERSYFNSEEKPYNAYGNVVTRWTYDSNGHLKTIRYYAADGSLAFNTMKGCAGYNYVHDERGNELEYYPIGRDEKLLNGKLSVQQKYDAADNVIEWSVYDKNGKPAINSSGIQKIQYVYNSRNQNIECRYFDEKGNPVLCDENYAIVRYEYDSRGNVVKVSYFDKKDQPTLCALGMASIVKEYDAFGRADRELNYGKDGKLTDPKVMTPVSVAEFDKQGHQICAAAYDADGNRILYKNSNYSFRRLEYDNRGNQLSLAFFDTKENPVVSKEDGYHKVVYTYDNRDLQLSEAFFNAAGKPMTKDGYHRQEYTYDEQGRKIIEQIFDVNGKPTNGDYGFSKAVYSFKGDSRTSYACKVYGPNGKLVNSYHRDAEGKWVRDQAPWQEEVRKMNDTECPLNLGKDYSDLVVLSYKVVNTTAAKVTFKAPKSKYEMTDEETNFYQAVVDFFVPNLKQKLPSSVKLTGVLIDSKNREIYSITK
jgi:serine/threonine-protein kinase